MADVYWLIDVSPAIPIDAVVGGEQLLVTAGETRVLPCRLADRGIDYPAVTGEACVTDLGDRYDAVRAYLKHPGAVRARGRDRNDIPWFVERQPPNTAAVDTQLVSVRPPDSVDVPDFYAVVVGGADRTPAVQLPYRIDLDLFILGPASDYDDRADVVSTHDDS